ncbi:oxidoreductase, short chain dehydrogenase/reductase family [Acanthamoeba castellanii str. Neff]|uniref:Oxidoreductase, short chain dehydrogenase/reductase family n=1 Tax=Acanthamoeba castellanii (strain ATCC 30010 / Neff) TaxID=1257118 RepID=L8HIS9_ACACF|nr:oxidoreductase, short chain dehydrogenase/reductase family [Acanthamoeba castellanii str. Neff]ELR25107.1 oxidoreductase, short chain dehydrogenase/reductase family [Acanthamoeba castellanii str. Neff]
MLECNLGNIMFVASEATIMVKLFMIHYNMTKTTQLTISHLAELTKGTNIHINTMLPGPTWTDGIATYIKGMAAQQGCINSSSIRAEGGILHSVV